MDQEQARLIARFLAATSRDNRNIAFVGRVDSQFAGNSKYLFLHFVANRPHYQSCYVTLNHKVFRELKAQRLPTALFPQQPALDVLAKAGIVVVEDFDYRTNNVCLFTPGAKIVQLWHGVGFKKIGFIEAETSIDLPEERRAHLRRMYSGYDALISTSPFYTENLFKTSFQADEIWETGYPRNDVLLRRPGRHDLVGSSVDLYAQLHAARKKQFTCIYAPTFRDDPNASFPHGAFDLLPLSAFLQRENIALYLKMHPFINLNHVPELPHIHILPSTMDIYPLLPLFDCMITDYSSIYMDYLLLDRPVLFFPFDREDYTRRMREFQFDYDVMTPGPKCLTQEALLEALRGAAHGDDAWAAERRRVCEMAFAHRDAKACSRIAAHIDKLIPASGTP